MHWPCACRCKQEAEGWPLGYVVCFLWVKGHMICACWIREGHAVVDKTESGSESSFPNVSVSDLNASFQTERGSTAFLNALKHQSSVDERCKSSSLFIWEQMKREQFGCRPPLFFPIVYWLNESLKFQGTTTEKSLSHPKHSPNLFQMLRSDFIPKQLRIPQKITPTLKSFSTSDLALWKPWSGV